MEVKLKERLCTTFKDIDAGSCFMRGGLVYLKLKDTWEYPNNNVFCFSDNTMHNFEGSMEVEVLDMVLVERGYEEC